MIGEAIFCVVPGLPPVAASKAAAGGCLSRGTPSAPTRPATPGVEPSEICDSLG